MTKFTNKTLVRASMGSKCSPSVCDVRAYQVINNVLDHFDTKDRIIFLGRFRDDGILTYSGSEEELHNFFQIANAIHPLLKFTYDISKTDVIFLDTTLYKGLRFHTNGILDIKSYSKPSNTYQYLHRSSLHNPAVFTGFIKGETTRHIRNNSNEDTLIQELTKFKNNLLIRGYKETEINKNIRSALSFERSELLKVNRVQKKDAIPLVFTTKYNHSVRRIGFYLRKKLAQIEKRFYMCENFREQPHSSLL